MSDVDPGGVSDGPDVFLSYAREDRALADDLVRRLRGQGIKVSWDADLQAATDFRAEIERLLAGSRLVVVLWSRWSVLSDHVRDEADIARERQKLVPASLDGSQPPLGFRGLQTEDLRGWVVGAPHPGVDRLIAAILARLHRPASPPSSQQPPRPAPAPAPRPVSQRRHPATTVLRIVVGLASIAVVGVLAIFVIRLVQNLLDDGGGAIEVIELRAEQILNRCEVSVGWLTDADGNALDIVRDGLVVAEDQPASVGFFEDRNVQPGRHVYTLAFEGDPLGAEAPINLQC